MYIEGLAIGNITQSEVEGMAARLRALLTAQLGTRPIFPSQVRRERRVMLRGGRRRVPDCSAPLSPLPFLCALSSPLPPSQCRDFRTVRLPDCSTLPSPPPPLPSPPLPVP